MPNENDVCLEVVEVVRKISGGIHLRIRHPKGHERSVTVPASFCPSVADYEEGDSPGIVDVPEWIARLRGVFDYRHKKPEKRSA